MEKCASGIDLNVGLWSFTILAISDNKQGKNIIN